MIVKRKSRNRETKIPICYLSGAMEDVFVWYAWYGVCAMWWLQSKHINESSNGMNPNWIECRWRRIGTFVLVLMYYTLFSQQFNVFFFLLHRHFMMPLAPHFNASHYSIHSPTKETNLIKKTQFILKMNEQKASRLPMMKLIDTSHRIESDRIGLNDWAFITDFQNITYSLRSESQRFKLNWIMK